MNIKKMGVYLQMALQVGKLSTCSRREVGCVLVDGQGRVMSTGYNGVPRDMPHCTLAPCSGAGFPKGERLELCEAIHAEQNALMHCNDVLNIKWCFSSTSPCRQCMKLLMNTSVQQLVFNKVYDEDVLMVASSRGLICTQLTYQNSGEVRVNMTWMSSLKEQGSRPRP